MGKRGTEHVKAQKEGRERDYGACQVCGSRRHPEGHHAVDYQYGGRADADNIVTLCRKCHDKVHRGDMDVFVI